MLIDTKLFLTLYHTTKSLTKFKAFADDILLKAIDQEIEKKKRFRKE